MKHKNEWSRQKSRAELEEALVRQISNLRRSNEAYDSGHLGEAERIASICYILLHDGHGKTRSLLGQLGLKSEMKFADTSLRRMVQGELDWLCMDLCKIKIPHDSKATYDPLRDTAHATGVHWVSFDEWWDRSKVYETLRGLDLSRKNLVLTMRNQDGGGHVDGQIGSEVYAWLASKGSDRIVSVKPGAVEFVIPPAPLPSEGFIENAHWATMRQIGWELDETIKLVGH